MTLPDTTKKLVRMEVTETMVTRLLNKDDSKKERGDLEPVGQMIERLLGRSCSYKSTHHGALLKFMTSVS